MCRNARAPILIEAHNDEINVTQNPASSSQYRSAYASWQFMASGLEPNCTFTSYLIGTFCLKPCASFLRPRRHLVRRVLVGLEFLWGPKRALCTKEARTRESPWKCGDEAEKSSHTAFCVDASHAANTLQRLGYRPGYIRPSGSLKAAGHQP